MDELKDVKKVAYGTATKLEVLERDYFIQVKMLNEKFDNLSEDIKDLTCELRTWNKNKTKL